MKPRTQKIYLLNVKEPEAFNDLCDELGVKDSVRSKHFECGEYANLEVEVDENLRIVGGRFLTLKEANRR